MLKKIYVNNYKSLVNTKIDVQAMTLLLGRNGAGKSAVFDVVSRVRDFLATSSGKVFRRTAGGPTDVEDYKRSGDEPLTVAEMMEMGELE